MLSHTNNSKTFEELTYAEQASSINSQIQNLKSQIIAHQKRALEENKNDPTKKFLNQLEKIIIDLN